MKQSPLLVFESPAFTVTPGEDAQTNPGLYGNSLAQWLAERLRASDVPVDTVIAEDFGWCIPVGSKPHALYVACASTGGRQNQWQVFVFAESGLLARMFGQDSSTDSVASLFATVSSLLESAPTVSGLREERIG